MMPFPEASSFPNFTEGTGAKEGSTALVCENALSAGTPVITKSAAVDKNLSKVVRFIRLLRYVMENRYGPVGKGLLNGRLIIYKMSQIAKHFNGRFLGLTLLSFAYSDKLFSY